MHPPCHRLPIDFVVGTNDSELTSFALFLFNIFSLLQLSPLEKGDTFICILLLAPLSPLVCHSEVTGRTGCYCPKCCLHTS